jgi:hypothetical protein
MALLAGSEFRRIPLFHALRRISFSLPLWRAHEQHHSTPPKHSNHCPEDYQCDDSHQLDPPNDAAEVEDGLPLDFSVLYHVRTHRFGIHPEPSSGVLAAAGRP